MHGVVIFDGKGYFVKRRRVDGRIVDLWSPRKQDAASFHFIEVARRFASTIPQRVRLLAPQQESDK
jgi:hypothetical protein